VVKRHPHSPVITREDISSTDPRLFDVTSVFNPGGIYHQGQIILLLRVQNRGRETYLVKATSRDGIEFDIATKPVEIRGMQDFPYPYYHIYDPRIVYIEGRYLVTCAVDSEAGCRVVLFESEDLDTLSYLGVLSDEGQRNGVLFPHRIEGRYWMLSRPNDHLGADGVRSGTRILAYASDDLCAWEEQGIVMQGRSHFWDELIGSGPPPLLTELGWLHIYHGVATHFGGGGIYQAGVSLLDATEPHKLLARGVYNILEPRADYETMGQVPNVVFPTVAINPVEGPLGMDTPIYIYYGAADSCIGLATTTLRTLLPYSGIDLGALP